MCIISRFVCMHTVHKLSDLNNEAKFNCLIYSVQNVTIITQLFIKRAGLQVCPNFICTHAVYWWSDYIAVLNCFGTCICHKMKTVLSPSSNMLNAIVRHDVNILHTANIVFCKAAVNQDVF